MATAEDTCRSMVDAVEITRTVDFFPFIMCLTLQEDHDACITYCTILHIHLENAMNFPPVDQNTILKTLANILDDTENVGTRPSFDADCRNISLKLLAGMWS